ncbi:MAG: FHA domain-containing protein [Pirellulales bacterium]|nr:FHA domain-containing protein [Pirellulales bacterium]
MSNVERILGELVPKGGGDPIPLLKKKLLIGRRESCDIVLRFANVSAHHCELTFKDGYLYVRDLSSRNGTKVNGMRVTEKRLDPGDDIVIAKHRYEVRYSPYALGAVGPPPPDEMSQAIMAESLLARAGLERRRGEDKEKTGERTDYERAKRYDPTDNRAGQIKLPDKPV